MKKQNQNSITKWTFICTLKKERRSFLNDNISTRLTDLKVSSKEHFYKDDQFKNKL